MAINYPTSLDVLTNPSSNSDTSTISHADQHANANDAIEALEAKVGINSSANTDSFDYKLTNSLSSNPGHKHTLAQGATDVTATVTEINYVDGVTSAIQTQLNAKAPIASPTLTGDATIPTIQGAASGAAFAVVKGIKDLGTVGATETVDWRNGDRQKMVLDENLTIDFSNAAEGQALALYMLQDGTGTNTITFTPTIIWANNTTPTWSTTASKMNIAIISYIGGAYYGFASIFA